MPERKEEILKNGRYLAKYIEAIAIRKTDIEANNGGCTEPHISHILASRLSTRPMAWSGETLVH
ncbi:MAG: ISLre2 family transposase, partial [Acutalibacteraceae bacterium]|nr:ISLre2 family transposase [Acutalibacteraceae bacterium]